MVDYDLLLLRLSYKLKQGGGQSAKHVCARSCLRYQTNPAATSRSLLCPVLCTLWLLRLERGAEQELQGCHSACQSLLLRRF